MAEIKTIKITPGEAEKLMAELDEYQGKLYPAESNHLDSIDKLEKPNVKMYGCRINGKLAAIGAVKLMDGYGEIKRLYVPQKHRGKGLAQTIMDKLEWVLSKKKIKFARLETGIHQTEAIGLYEKRGYVECGAFGDYSEDPLSVFLEKRLREVNND